MTDPLPRTLGELEYAASVLDAELARSLTLLRHLGSDLRPETVVEYARRTADLEELARKFGLALPEEAAVPPTERG